MIGSAFFLAIDAFAVNFFITGSADAPAVGVADLIGPAFGYAFAIGIKGMIRRAIGNAATIGIKFETFGASALDPYFNTVMRRGAGYRDAFFPRRIFAVVGHQVQGEGFTVLFDQLDFKNAVDVCAQV